MRKIYLVEDDKAIREVLEMILASESFSVTSFGSVNEFNERDTHENPDLYLFDVLLPDGLGTDLCRQIKMDQQNEGIPVVIMSAHAQLHHLANICEPDDFIAKPFDIDDILTRVKNILD